MNKILWHSLTDTHLSVFRLQMKNPSVLFEDSFQVTLFDNRFYRPTVTYYVQTLKIITFPLSKYKNATKETVIQIVA